MSAAPQKAKPGAEKIEVTVDAVVPVNELITRFEFKRRDGQPFPPYSGGAHTVVEMKDGDRTRLNPYSLMSNPTDLSKYSISVRRDDEGRGGSLFMHRNVKEGDEMTITYPVNLFSMDLRARKHIFFADKSTYTRHDFLAGFMFFIIKPMIAVNKFAIRRNHIGLALAAGTAAT